MPTQMQRRVKRNRPKPIRKTSKARLSDLKKTLAVVFVVLIEKTLAVVFVVLIEKTAGDLKEMSNLTGLSKNTLMRIANNDFTLRIQYRTVQAVCMAAGFMIDFAESGETYLVIADDRIKRKPRKKDESKTKES